MLKSDSLFYLLGLICGKGNILGKNNFAINFNHKDKFLELRQKYSTYHAQFLYFNL